jgi:hypothetical protein
MLYATQTRTSNYWKSLILQNVISWPSTTLGVYASRPPAVQWKSIGYRMMDKGKLNTI